MSNECVSIAQKRKVGSATKKAVLVYLADRASDDGSGIWTSKAHISADTELSKRSVQNVIADFVADGLLVKVGTRGCANGFTYEYRIDLAKLLALPSTRKQTGESPAPVHHVHPTHAPDAPQDVHHVHPNHPRTTHEPPNKVEGDLFSQSQQSAPQPDPEFEAIEAGFEEFWNEIWPSHFRKKAKKDCRKVYLQACTGKHTKADPVSPTSLNRAAREYIKSVRDPQYLKGTLPWLREPGWEPFLETSQPQQSPRQSRYQQIIQEHSPYAGGMQ